jgi:hypothetical protein
MSFYNNVFSKVFLLLLFVITFNSINASSPVQTVKGFVYNSDNRQPVAGATVFIEGTELGAFAGSGGEFEIDNVPVGRHTIRTSSIGYDTFSENIVVTSGKENILNIYLNQSYVEAEEITVTANKSTFTPINESVMVSSTAFTIDDAQRFAGSRMDPARMAQNFAGVVGANDTRNDIIIRGGSPVELLWRIDGLDIPNPNHFATQGATGGPVGAINTMLLDNSDFLTGAFPAQYADKMSGVFDLRTRVPNMQNHEYYGQFGFNGFELGAEGPLVKDKMSYLLNYRYSFLDLMEKMGFDFGFSGIPRYQDGSLKVNLFANEKHRLSLTGLMGVSSINILESETDDVFTGDQDIKNGTDFYGTILNWQYLVSENFYAHFALGSTTGWFNTALDSITTDNDNNVLSLDKWFEQESYEGYHTIKADFNLKAGRNGLLSFGSELRSRFYDFYEKRFTTGADNDDLYYVNKNGNALQTISFINWKNKFSRNFNVNIGVVSQYLDINNEITVEPRLSAEYIINDRNILSAGFGVHRQSLPLVLHYSENTNEELDFMQSVHYVAGYSLMLNQETQMKIEGYYKDLSHIPVEAGDESSWSFANSGTNFGGVAYGVDAVSDGTGRAYGAELSLIKHFTKGYYYNLTASYIRQQYTGSDGVRRFGNFDNVYVFNALAGYEWLISDDFSIEFSGKYTVVGGNPYTPIDMEESSLKNGTYYIDSKAFSLRNSDYSRLDIRIDFRQNLKNMAIISYFSVENLLNTENTLMRVYDAKNDEVEMINQLGLFPIGGIRIEF